MQVPCRNRGGLPGWRYIEGPGLGLSERVVGWWCEVARVGVEWHREEERWPGELGTEAAGRQLVAAQAHACFNKPDKRRRRRRRRSRLPAQSDVLGGLSNRGLEGQSVEQATQVQQLHAGLRRVDGVGNVSTGFLWLDRVKHLI